MKQISQHSADVPLDHWLNPVCAIFVVLASWAVSLSDSTPIYFGIVLLAAIVFLGLAWYAEKRNVGLESTLSSHVHLGESFGRQATNPTELPPQAERLNIPTASRLTLFQVGASHSDPNAKKIFEPFVLSAGWTHLFSVIAALTILPAFFALERYTMLAAAGHCFALLQAILFFQNRDARIVRRQVQVGAIQLMLAAMLTESTAFAILLIAIAPMLLILLAVVALHQQREDFAFSPGFCCSSDVLTLPHRRAVAAREQKLRQPRWGKKKGGATAESSRGMRGLYWNASLPSIPRRWFWVFRLISLGIPTLMLAFCVFFLFPRFGGEPWHGSSRDGSSGFVGFADTIRLGEMSPMLDNTEEVARIQLLNPAITDGQGQFAVIRPSTDTGLYIRGSTVNLYEDGRWALVPSVHPKSLQIQSLSELDSLTPRVGEFSLYQPRIDRLNSLLTGQPLIRELIQLRSSRRSEVFCVWPPLFSTVENPHQLYYDGEQEKLFQREEARDEQMVVRGTREVQVATLGMAGSSQIQLAPNLEPNYLPKTASELLTRIPKPERLEGIHRISDQWFAGLDESVRKNPRLVAELFEAKFKNSAAFTYQVGGVKRDPALDPMEDFMTLHPQGHCEYFASALALALRFQKIPCRVVLGFCTSEYLETSGMFRARQQHAHAWVEAYVPPEELPDSGLPFCPSAWRYGGWLRLDPTPATHSSTFWNSPVAQAFDSIDWFWRQYVVSMDESRQKTLYAPVERRLRPMLEWLMSMPLMDLFQGLKERFGSAAPWIQGGILLIGLLAGYVLWRLLRPVAWLLYRWLAALIKEFTLLTQITKLSSRRQTVDATQAHAKKEADQIFQRWENLMRTYGLRRSPFETQREFVQRCNSRLQTLYGERWQTREARQFIAIFYALRFGYYPLDVETAKRLTDFLQATARLAPIPQAR